MGNCNALRNVFLSFCRNEIGRGDMLTFEHFEDLLKIYGDINKENGEIAEIINKTVNSSCEFYS